MTDQWPPPRNRGESDAAYQQRVAQLKAFLIKRSQPNKGGSVQGKKVAPDQPQTQPKPSPTKGGLYGIFDTISEALK